MDSYKTKPNSSIFNFKTAYNGLTEDLGFQEFHNKIKNPSFIEQRSSNVFAWSAAGLDINAPLELTYEYVKYNFPIGSMIQQQLMFDFKHDTEYTLVFEGNINALVNDIYLEVFTDDGSVDFIYNSTPTDEVSQEVFEGTNVIRFKTKASGDFTSDYFLRLVNSNTTTDTDIVIRNLVLTEGNIALLGARYNEIDQLIRWNNTNDYWEISIDNEVTWERIWTDCTDFTDRLNTIVTAQLIDVVHSDNILAGPGITITHTSIDDGTGTGNTTPQVTITATSAGTVTNRPWDTVNTNSAVAAFSKTLVDTTGGAVTITLPAGPDIGDEILLGDLEGTFNTNNLIIDGSGYNINSHPTFVIEDNFAQIKLIYINSSVGWRIYHHYSFTA